jgi:hypothetical protein
MISSFSPFLLCPLRRFETLKTPSCESLDLRAKLAHLSDLLSVEEEQDGGRDHGYAEECEE